MFELLLSLLCIAAFLVLYFGTVPLVIAFRQGDEKRISRILDKHLEMSEAMMSALVGMLKIFRRREGSPPPPDKT